MIVRYEAHGATPDEVELDAAGVCNHLFPHDRKAVYVVVDCTADRVNTASGEQLQMTLHADVVAGSPGELRAAGYTVN